MRPSVFCTESDVSSVLIVMPSAVVSCLTGTAGQSRRTIWYRSMSDSAKAPSASQPHAEDGRRDGFDPQHAASIELQVGNFARSRTSGRQQHRNCRPIRPHADASHDYLTSSMSHVENHICSSMTQGWRYSRLSNPFAAGLLVKVSVLESKINFWPPSR